MRLHPPVITAWCCFFIALITFLGTLIATHDLYASHTSGETIYYSGARDTIRQEVTREENPALFETAQKRHTFDIAQYGILSLVTFAFFLKLKDL